PRELVYLFRAATLLEGIGFRYDPAFNGLDSIKRVVRRIKGELMPAAGATGASAGGMFPSAAMLGRFTGEALSTLTGLQDVLKRAEREEFRIRLHPRDVRQAERFGGLQVRRVLLSIFALTIALISSITFVAVRNPWLLGGGLLVALVMFFIVLVLPVHLLENPLRHARSLHPEMVRSLGDDVPAGGERPAAPGAATARSRDVARRGTGRRE
ncbi:MAG TPA: hypothetical protein VMK65_01355, partial [Longimicrobiales bacterium]|nr:hypothetical protein [Longimicrobiales bacterium]